MTERLLKPEETAQLLGTTVKTLAVQRCKGMGAPFVRLGRSIRYKESEIAEFIKNLTA